MMVVNNPFKDIISWGGGSGGHPWISMRSSFAKINGLLPNSSISSDQSRSWKTGSQNHPPNDKESGTKTCRDHKGGVQGEGVFLGNPKDSVWEDWGSP